LVTKRKYGSFTNRKLWVQGKLRFRAGLILEKFKRLQTNNFHQIIKILKQIIQKTVRTQLLPRLTPIRHSQSQTISKTNQNQQILPSHQPLSQQLNPLKTLPWNKTKPKQLQSNKTKPKQLQSRIRNRMKLNKQQNLNKTQRRRPLKTKL